MPWKTPLLSYMQSSERYDCFLLTGPIEAAGSLTMRFCLLSIQEAVPLPHKRTSWKLQKIS